MRFVPMYDRVLIVPKDEPQEVDGLTLPDIAKRDFRMGTVLAIGEGYVDNEGQVRPLRLRVGETVLFGPYSGTPVQVEGHELLVMREGEVAGRLLSE